MTAPLEPERKMGMRRLRAGEVVKIKGKPGEYTIRGFRGDTVEVIGGPAGRVAAFRCFHVDRIGARPRTTKVRTPKGTTVQRAAGQ